MWNIGDPTEAWWIAAEKLEHHLLFFYCVLKKTALDGVENYRYRTVIWRLTQ